MSENMERWRHMDGSPAVIETEHMRIVFQHGDPEKVGINGVRLEEVIETLIQKILDFQGRDLSCEENKVALHHLAEAQEALVQRRRRREEQHLIGTKSPHRSEDREHTLVLPPL